MLDSNETNANRPQTQIIIRPVHSGDRPEWLRMRLALYATDDPKLIESELEQIVDGSLKLEALVAVLPSGRLGGFVEISILPRAVGCEIGPIGYIESWYVDPDLRRSGIGRQLLLAAEHWATDHGCHEMASDCDLQNETSHTAHLKIGYQETARLIHFRKPIGKLGVRF